jgi:predicted metal-dependent hydrolase
MGVVLYRRPVDVRFPSAGAVPRLQDYVIVHELLHFSVPNHGPLWKSLMRAHLGDYENRDRELRNVAPRGAA